MPELVFSTEIAAPRDRCFALSLSVDAHTSSMKSSGEEVIGGVRSGAMAFGDTVTWRARHFGIPFRMTSRITEYDAPMRFVDEQMQGPFASWWHEHRFDETDGRTMMTDAVRFRSPLGPIGRLVDRAVLQRYLAGLLEQRNAWLKDELESGSRPHG